MNKSTVKYSEVVVEKIFMLMGKLIVKHSEIVGGKFFMLMEEKAGFPAGTICTKLTKNNVPVDEEGVHNSVKRGKTFYVPEDELVLMGK